MRIEHGPRFLAYGFIAVVGIALTASSGHSQPFEYVITFDNVVVRGVDSVETPEVAHRELAGLDKLLPPVEAEAGGTKRGEGTATPSPPPLPKLTRRPLGSGLPFEPGQGIENPSFIQNGFLVEAFWGIKVGTLEGFFKRAHFHPTDLSSGFEAQHLGHPNELHGLYVRSVDGKRFGLKSLRYRVTRNRQIPSKSLSIEGFSNFNVNVLIARSFDPRNPIRVQFVALPIGLPVGNDPSLPWWTLRIDGFQLLDQVYIASSASVDFDDIVLTRNEPPPMPADRQEEKK